MDLFGQAINPFADPTGGGLPSSTCPEGFETFSGSCYHFGEHSSYITASAKCQEYGAELVAVHDRNLGMLREI